MIECKTGWFEVTLVVDRTGKKLQAPIIFWVLTQQGGMIGYKKTGY